MTAVKTAAARKIGKLKKALLAVHADHFYFLTHYPSHTEALRVFTARIHQLQAEIKALEEEP